jgi:hypothetical protein
MQKGQSVLVVCNSFGRPSTEAKQILPGRIMAITQMQYAVEIEQPGGNWLVTLVDDSLLIPTRRFPWQKLA